MDKIFTLPVFLILFSAFCILLVINIILTKRNNKKTLTKIKEKLSFLDSRINYEEFEVNLRKESPSKWEGIANDTIEKYNLIDGLIDIKENITNYDEVISDLNKKKPSDVSETVERIRRQVRNAREKAERKERLENSYGVEIASQIINQEYFLGMTEEHLKECRGNPTKIEQEVLKTKTKIVYIYGNKSSGDVFTFVNGELERFKDR